MMLNTILSSLILLFVVTAQLYQQKSKISHTDKYFINVSLSQDSCVCNNCDVKLDSSLVAFYPFNGDADDESGNGHNGIINGATLTTDRFGNIDSAYEFDGINDFIDLPDDTLLELDFPISISVWFEIDQNAESYDAGIFNSDYVENNYHGISCNANTEFLSAYFGDGSGCTCSSSRRGIKFDTLITKDTFHHMAVVFYNPNDIDLYFNCQLVSQQLSGSAGPQIAYSLSGGVIGKTDISTNNPTINFFQGKIDEFRMYSRALNCAEIVALYEDGCKDHLVISNLVLQHDTTFNANQSIQLNDVTVNNNACVILNAPEIVINAESENQLNSKIETQLEDNCNN